MFCSMDIDTCWSLWKTAFLDIMNNGIPQTTLPERRTCPLDDYKGVVQTIRKRNYYFKKAKRTGDTNAQDRYKQLRTSVVSQLRQQKSEFFQKFDSGSALDFWRAARLLDNRKTSFPMLSNGSDNVSDDVEKAELLNCIFVNSFNKDVSPLGNSPPFSLPIVIRIWRTCSAVMKKFVIFLPALIALNPVVMMLSLVQCLNQQHQQLHQL